MGRGQEFFKKSFILVTEAFCLAKFTQSNSFSRYQAEFSSLYTSQNIRIVGWIRFALSTLRNIFIFQLLKYLCITIRAEFGNENIHIRLRTHPFLEFP
jgi:hypothetical protein